MTSSRSDILVVDDDPAQCRIVSFWLEKAGFSPTAYHSGEDGLAALRQTAPDAVLLDLGLPGISGLETLEVIRRRNPHLPVIILTADDNVETVVEAMQRKATDYLVKPLEQQRLVLSTQNAVEHYRMTLRLKGLEHATEAGGFGAIVGASPPMRELYQRIERVAPTDVTVLIRGESGTGKELVARALHDHGARAGKPFVAINCAAVPETMQESELFGHERGAFTGAAQRHLGRFEQADGGTLFLDEVGELSAPLQAKLLRAIQERSFYRVGGTREIKVDVRLVAATHRDLREEVSQARFREDLYYRLAVYELLLPPLRDRGADIDQLVRRFAEHYGPGLNRQARFERSALEAMRQYRWPGNIRELQNVVQQALLNSHDDLIRASDLPAYVAARQAPIVAAAPAGSAGPTSVPPIPVMSLEALERGAIAASMERHEGRAADVIAELEIPRTTLYRKLKLYGLK